MRLDLSAIRMFQDKLLPDEAKLAGWAALVHALSVRAPIRRPTCVSDQHVRGSRRDQDGWRIFDKRYWPGDHLGDHLTFALRHEDIDLLVLKRVFEAVPKAEVEALVLDVPTGIPSATNLVSIRDAYRPDVGHPRRAKRRGGGPARSESLLRRKAKAVTAPSRSRQSPRHGRILPGHPAYSQRWSILQSCALGDRSAARPSAEPAAHVVARAASFMLLADSRASFEIEGERPPRNRLERWGAQSFRPAKTSSRLEEIIRLHRVLIEDTRFVRPGLTSGRRLHGRPRS